jgi:hypothetical protein
MATCFSPQQTIFGPQTSKSYEAITCKSLTNIEIPSASYCFLGVCALKPRILKIYIIQNIKEVKPSYLTHFKQWWNLLTLEKIHKIRKFPSQYCFLTDVCECLLYIPDCCLLVDKCLGLAGCIFYWLREEHQRKQLCDRLDVIQDRILH